MDLAAARDIAIIILAIFNIISAIIVIIILIVLVQLLRNQVIPLLNSLRRTANTVEGTTTYISRTAVSPMARIAGVSAGVFEFWRTLRRGRGRKGDGK